MINFKRCSICNKSNIFFKMSTKEGKTICGNCLYKFKRINMIFEDYNQELLENSSYDEIYNSVVNNKRIKDLNFEKYLQNTKKETNTSISPSISINFKVSGITLKNETNKNIQIELNKLLNTYKKAGVFDGELYGGYSNKEIIDYDVEPYEYEDVTLNKVYIEPNDKNRFKIYLYDYYNNKIHVGFIPQNKTAEYKNLTSSYLAKGCKIKINGGKQKYASLDFETKHVNTTKLSNYSLDITLYFKPK